MKPTVAADEMFPEGVGPYMDLEEVSLYLSIIYNKFIGKSKLYIEYFKSNLGRDLLLISSQNVCMYVQGKLKKYCIEMLNNFA